MYSARIDSSASISMLRWKGFCQNDRGTWGRGGDPRTLLIVLEKGENIYNKLVAALVLFFIEVFFAFWIWSARWDLILVREIHSNLKTR